MKLRLVAWLISLFYRLWIWTWRTTIVEDPRFQEALKKKEPLILAFWHGDELAILYCRIRYKVCVMTSLSKDGELMTRVSENLGIACSRGSSSRGGVSALKGILRLARTRMPAVPVDGPKGPIYVPKPGVFEISRVLGAKIVPGGASADRAIVFHKAWNKSFLAKPFSRVAIHWGEPLPAVTKDQDPRDPALSARLTQALHDSRREAEKIIAAV